MLYLNILSIAASSQELMSSPAVWSSALTDCIMERFMRSAIPFYCGWWGVRRWSVRPYCRYSACIVLEVYSLAFLVQNSRSWWCMREVMWLRIACMCLCMSFLSLINWTSTNLLTAQITSSMWLFPCRDVGLIGPQVSELT